MIITGLDTETTGLDVEKGHRIIEIALISYELKSQKKIGEYIVRVDPERAIDQKAQEVHGIAYSDLVGCPKWKGDVANEVASIMSKSDLLVAHNMGFDGPFIATELIQAGVKVPDVNAFCTAANGRWATFDGKTPKLAELCFALGVPYDPAKAHAANYDVEVTMECFFKGMQRGFYKPPLPSFRNDVKVAA